VLVNGVPNDNFNPVAGGGQRDIWANGGVTGCLVSYVGGAADLLYVSDPFNPNTSTTQYSHDGGNSWSTISWTGGAPSIVAAIVGSDNNGHYVALCGSTDYPYYGTNGTSFAKSGNAFPGSVGITSSNIIWYSGASLFVCASLVSSTQMICTSNDYGVTWVAQTTPNIGSPAFTTYMSLATDGSTIVCAGGDSGFVLYSTNGTTWSTATTTPSSPTTPTSLSYSAEKKEWFFQDSADGTGYKSTDGITFTALGIVGSAGAICSFWCPEYSQWYIPYVDGNNSNNYTLLATPDLSLAFQLCSLDGSRDASFGYNTGLYMAKYDTFVIGTSDAGGIAVSTARPTTIKSVGDDIRVRDMPVTCAKFSTFTTANANSTTVETTLSNPASYLGSLTFQANQPLGMVIDLDFNVTVTSAGGDTLTIRYYNNVATSLWSHVLTIPASSTNLGIGIRSRITIVSGNIQYNSQAVVSGHAATIVSGSHGWTQGVNALSITGQWSANASTCQMNQLICTTLFPNGA
jgi:hypothetical protein